jgi:hypothetical protein
MVERRGGFGSRVFGLALGLGLAVGQLGFSGALPAAAHDDCQHTGSTNGSPWTYSYTQDDPWYPWPASGAPQCGTNPAPSQCAWWDMPNGGPGNVDADFTGTYPQVSGVNFYDDLITAMHAWAGQPYNSPWMYQCTASANNCQYSQVHLGSKDEGQITQSGNTIIGTCGLTYDYTISSSSDSRMSSSTIMLNNNSSVNWWDGQPAAGQYGCDAKATAFHEEGHTFTLGHSSVSGEVMYWGGGDVATVTSAAQRGLNAIYGPYTRGGNSCGASCNNSCLGQVEALLCSTLGGAVGYYQKAWQMSQGVSVPNPVSIITPSSCEGYGNNYSAWLSCILLYYRGH